MIHVSLGVTYWLEGKIEFRIQFPKVAEGSVHHWKMVLPLGFGSQLLIHSHGMHINLLISSQHALMLLSAYEAEIHTNTHKKCVQF